MRIIRRLLGLIGLTVLVAATGVEAAVTLRAAAFPAVDVYSGYARCAATNTGTVSGPVSITMYSQFGDVIWSTPTAPLLAKRTVFTYAAHLQFEIPTHCECVVPNGANFRCAFTYVDGNTVTIIPAP